MTGARGLPAIAVFVGVCALLPALTDSGVLLTFLIPIGYMLKRSVEHDGEQLDSQRG